MIKVFLVEDEVVIRNGIKNSIPWEKEGFEFVGEASDGELAYPLIKKEKPDILITDIRMPFMDGLELSRIVKRELPQIRILILSGYNEFDYAKQAIDIGVTQYLLKPISSAKLVKTLKEVGEDIEREREHSRMLERYHREMEENVRLEQQKLWSALIANSLTMAELLEGGRRVGMDFTAPVYQVFLFRISQNGGALADCSRNLIEAEERIVRAAEDWPQVLTFDRSPEGWVFLIKAETDEEANARLEECARTLTALVEERSGIEYFGGVGPAVRRLGDIRNSYREAGKAFASRFFGAPNRIVRPEDLLHLQEAGAERIDISNVRSRKAERELVDRFLRSGTQEEVGSFVEEYFAELGEKNYQSMLYRQYVLMDLYFSAVDFLDDLKIRQENLPESCRDINGIVSERSAQAMKEKVKELFTETLKLRDQHSQKRYSVILEEARQFIQENYRREDMSLNTVASQVNISPSYFSAIFSAETGQTFVEYLTQVRLDKAKELLMCTTMRTAEIGYEVGYKDSHYFSYIFKKIVGCSPKEYKNRGKE